MNEVSPEFSLTRCVSLTVFSAFLISEIRTVECEMCYHIV